MSVSVVKDFLNSEELEFLDSLFGIVESNRMWESDKTQYWDGRTYNLTRYLDQTNDIVGHRNIVKTAKKIKGAVCQNFSASSIFCDSLKLIKWREGEMQEPHYDNRPRDRAPWREYSSVLYLNSVEGGEIYFPDLGQQYPALAGQLVTFPSGKEYLHGVKPLISPIRKTITMFWTFDKSKDILGI